MKILILNWKDPLHPAVGGAEIIALEFARRLSLLGHDVTWYARSFPGGKREEQIDRIRVVRRGGVISTYFHAPLFYFRAGTRPDIVLDMVNTVCWQASIFARNKTIGYVNQLAGPVFSYHLRWPISRLAYVAEKYQYLSYRHCKMLCYSNSTRNDLLKLGIRPENIHQFSLGLDHTRYHPGTEKSVFPLFITVSRLVKMKRTYLAVMAMKLVLDNQPDAKLVIIGSGPEEPRLRRLIYRLGISDAVEIVGEGAFYLSKTEGDLKVELMQRAWAHILLSVKEGWGMVVTESAACGTPSIVTDVSGLRDSVHHGETGLLLPGNPSLEDIAGAMLKIAQHDELRQKLSAGAEQWARKFNWDRSFAEFHSGLR